jgi:hypothetical protein
VTVVLIPGPLPFRSSLVEESLEHPADGSPGGVGFLADQHLLPVEVEVHGDRAEDGVGEAVDVLGVEAVGVEEVDQDVEVEVVRGAHGLAVRVRDVGDDEVVKIDVGTSLTPAGWKLDLGVVVLVVAGWVLSDTCLRADLSVC